LYDPDQGLGRRLLAQTDVLLYWAHHAHRDIAEENVQALRQRIYEGMGFIALHSAHESKIFKALYGYRVRTHQMARKRRVRAYFGLWSRGIP
jgi:trehalose utilization protein